MRIIIAGAGEVGTHLAKLLSQEAQDIIVLDKDPARMAQIDSTCNVMTHTANPISIDAQREIGTAGCDLFIGVTPFETENIVACQIAKQLGAKQTVARIDSYEWMDKRNAEVAHGMGLDQTVYPEHLAAKEIITSLKRTWVRGWFELYNGEIIVVGVKLRENARIAGMQLKDFARQEHNFHVDAIRRRHEILIPRGEDRLQPNDILYFTTTARHVEELREMCGKTQHNVSRVMIIGATRIALRLVKSAPKHLKFKVIESDYDRCRKMASQCTDIEIIHGDTRDIDLLREEGIGDMDAFIALTDSPEANILACMTAKEFGVKKTIADIENLRLIPEAESLNVGTVINKKLLASSRIFQLLLDSAAENPRCLALADAEVAEMVVRPGSKVTKGPVKDLKIPREVNIGGLVRNGVGHLVAGSTVMEPGDRVVVFCLAGHLHKAEKLFT